MPDYLGSSIPLGAAVLELRTDTKQLKSGLADAKKQVNQTSNAIKLRWEPSRLRVEYRRFLVQLPPRLRKLRE